MASSSDWIVLKFGGTSVSSRARWDVIAGVVREQLDAGLRPLLVCSAVSRVSRLLHALLKDAVHDQHGPVLEELRAIHLELADALGLDGEALLGETFDELARVAQGISLTGLVGPPLEARVLARGELMSTTLGAAFLAAQGLSTRLRDARELLRSNDPPRTLLHRRYLSATCDFAPDPDLQARLAADEAAVQLTQGFIASNPAGDTVLVGWGGSDTSAAYLASKLQARRLEIWTDVPGLFTTNPRQVPSARLLRQLDYEEAQELASTGAEVLHPRSLEPVRRQQIPLHVRCTEAPAMEHTVISDRGPDFGARVKAISARKGITLISMESSGMWQQVGFLARVFAIFADHDLSVDLVATSETNVTVSLDAEGNYVDRDVLRALKNDLGAFCEVQELGPCAAVSLVGRNLRSILYELAPTLEALDEQPVHLVTQAASDLNFTFVVDEEHADRLVRKLHALLFAGQEVDGLFGPSWHMLFEEHNGRAVRPDPWWMHRRQDLLARAEEAAPCYVYDEATVQTQIDRLGALGAVDRFFYAMKANPHPSLLRRMHAAGLGFECVSPGEIEHVRTLFPDLASDRLLFTPNFAPRDDYAAAYAAGAHVTLDNVYPLEAWPDVFRGRDLIVRLDPGRGHGHHRHVRTAGAQSKFGVTPGELERLQAAAAAADVRIVGLHAHVGSGITVAETWLDTAVFLASLAGRFPDVKVLNLGGGLGVPDRDGTPPLDLALLGEHLQQFHEAQPRFRLWMEPGRFLSAEAGVLLARVTQVKDKGDVHYVGVETGINSLIRPALYGAYHEIVNLTRLDEPMAITAEIVGPICETGDVLGHGRRLPETREGDVLLVATAGAYGHVMSSRYNLRAPAAETSLAPEAGAV